MKIAFIFVIGLAAFFIGAFFGVWFSQQRFDDKVSELNAAHELDWAGQAFLNLTEWQHGSTNFVHDDLVFKMEYGVVTLTPYIEKHPQSEVTTHYHEMMENIRQYRARFRWYSGMTNWDSDFDKVLTKTAKDTNN